MVLFLSLSIRNLIPIDEYGIYQVIVYENTWSQHYTFCSQECRKEIDNYLEFRKRNGETIKPESPIIREQFNTRNRGIGSAKPRFLKDRALTKIIEQVIKVDAGIKKRRLVEKTPTRLPFGRLCNLRPINPTTTITITTISTNTTTATTDTIDQYDDEDEDDITTTITNNNNSSSIKIMGISYNIYEKLREHSRKYHNQPISYDDIFEELYTFYNKNHEQKYFLT